MRNTLFQAAGLTLLASTAFVAQSQTPIDQSQVGPGNATAAAISAKSPIVASAMHYLGTQAMTIHDGYLRQQTLDGVTNPKTCIRHRANLKLADKQAILQNLIAAGLIDPADAPTIPGGLLAGVFPGVLNDGTACPQFPQPFSSAPGSSFGSHHSYPGGLPVHESNNDTADVNLAREYREVYGYPAEQDAIPVINQDAINNREDVTEAAFYLNPDNIVGAPLWHDWAKPMVFQWNADGTEYIELSIGDTRTSATLGAGKTGGHHILSIAESMKRGFAPSFVITQASAHSAPTLGNEYKVVNWLRAAAIIAQIDPIAIGYLRIDGTGAYRLPKLRQLGQIDLDADGQANLLIEYQLHNLSDADFTESIPAIGIAQTVLAQLAPEFGYDPTDVTNYNTKYRNVALSYFTAERIHGSYASGGLAQVRAELTVLRTQGIL